MYTVKIVRPNRTVVVRSNPGGPVVRVIQSASPLPIAGGEVADPGDLTVYFDNKLI